MSSLCFKRQGTHGRCHGGRGWCSCVLVSTPVMEVCGHLGCTSAQYDHAIVSKIKNKWKPVTIVTNVSRKGQRSQGRQILLKHVHVPKVYWIWNWLSKQGTDINVILAHCAATKGGQSTVALKGTSRAPKGLPYKDWLFSSNFIEMLWKWKRRHKSNFDLWVCTKSGPKYCYPKRQI